MFITKKNYEKALQRERDAVVKEFADERRFNQIWDQIWDLQKRIIKLEHMLGESDDEPGTTDC